MIQWRSLLPWAKKSDNWLSGSLSIEEVFREMFGGYATRSGIDINWKTALEVTTVWRCALRITDGLSTVPLRIYRESGGKRQPATEHPLYNLFAFAPNEWQDTLQFRETICLHVVLSGNAYVFINRLKNGRITELLPLEPACVEVTQNDDFSLAYTVTGKDGKKKEVPAKYMWHIRGPSWCGWRGLDPMKLLREPISLAKGLEASHASYHKNGMQTSGVYSVEGVLTDDQVKRLRAYLKANAVGFANSGEPLILDRAAKWTSRGMTGVDAEHLGTRRHQIEEICAGMGVMPIMVGYSDKTATYASAEQMFLAHSVHTTRPWQRRLEASIKKNLLTLPELLDGYYPKFIDTELLRGAAKDRAEYYAKGISSGWLTRNEVREFEEMNPLEGLDEPLSPVNMVVGNPEPQAEPQPSQGAQNDGT